MLLGVIFCAFIGLVALLKLHILTALLCFGIAFLIFMFGSKV